MKLLQQRVVYLARFDLNQGVRRMRFRDRSAFPIVGIKLVF